MHLLDKNEKIVCAWLVIPEHTLTTRKDTLLPSSIELHENNLIALHSGHPEVQCLKLGIGWENIQKYQKTTLLESRIDGQKGRLNLPNELAGKYDFSTNQHDYNESIGFYQSRNDGVGIPVSMVEKLTGKNQIILEGNNNLKTSSNLSGKKIQIRMPIYYPEVLIKKANVKFNRLDAVIALKRNNTFRVINLISGKLIFQESANEEKIIFTDWKEYRSHVLHARPTQIN